MSVLVTLSNCGSNDSFIYHVSEIEIVGNEFAEESINRKRETENEGKSKQNTFVRMKANQNESRLLLCALRVCSDDRNWVCI